MNNRSVRLVPVGPDDAAVMAQLLSQNRRFLEPWSPLRDDAWFSVDSRRADLIADAAEHANGTGYHFAIVVAGVIVGRVDLSNVVRGAWRNATVGYWVAERECGKGYATASLRAATSFAFTQAGLHRMQAAVMPRNIASLKVVRKAGYRDEGLAERYLRINGVWEDHLIHAVTAEEWP